MGDPDDVGFHLGADRFGIQGGPLNVVLGNGVLNGGGLDFELLEMDDVCAYTIKYYPVNAPSVGKQIFIDETELWDTFYQPARLASTPEKGFFKKCKFTLFDNGKYISDFEY